MPYTQAIFANNEFYHVFNRGVEKRTIFTNKRDYDRFLSAMEYYRAKDPVTRFSFKDRPINKSENKSVSYLAEIACFCLMPNHFHMLIKQVENNGVSTFLSKLANSYTKYFNTKYNRVGPLFQGSFKAVRIESDEQLLHISRYIHLNPLIDYLIKDLKTYPYSSYPEFLGIKTGYSHKKYILSNFSKLSDYEKFVLDQEDYGRTIKNMERQLLDIEC
jgi:putative transposase